MTTIATTKFISGFKSVNTKLMHMCMIYNNNRYIVLD